jgi:hypothetical protein
MLLSILLTILGNPVGGKIICSETKQPIAGVMVYSSTDTTYTLPDGRFTIETSGEVHFKMLGYLPASSDNPSAVLELNPRIPEKISIKKSR